MAAKKYEIDTTTGKMFGKIISFAIPIMFSGIFQNLFNVVDMAVVGKYVGDGALAAVGSTSSLITLITNLFIGLSQGSTIMISRYFGEKDNVKMHRASHTAILLSIIGGIILGIIGFVFARTFIKMMGSPDDVINLATLYVKIYFLGMPFIMLYNFSSGVMRAYGDSKRPLYYLIVSGILNLILNVIFVTVFKMNVEGVAIATVISQAVSSLLNLRIMLKIENACRIELKKLKIYSDELLNIVRVGLPAGISSTLFSVSNVIIQSAVNSFGSTVMAAHGASNYVGNIIGTAITAFSNAATTTCSQNFGAKNKERIFKGWAICLLSGIVLSLILAMISVICAPYIMRIFTDNEETVNTGIYRIKVQVPFYFLLAVMNVSTMSLRGIGISLTPTLISFVGSCVLRVIWIYTVFALIPTLFCLYVSYPITWFITGFVQTVFFIYKCRKLDFTDK